MDSRLNSLSKTGKLIIYTYMVITCLISVFPILWIFLSSLKADPMKNPGISLPTDLSFDGYIKVFTELHVLDYFWNSFKVVSISVIISIIMISMSSYVIARMDFRGKNQSYWCIINPQNIYQAIDWKCHSCSRDKKS